MLLARGVSTHHGGDGQTKFCRREFCAPAAPPTLSTIARSTVPKEMLVQPIGSIVCYTHTRCILRWSGQTWTSRMRKQLHFSRAPSARVERGRDFADATRAPQNGKDQQPLQVYVNNRCTLKMAEMNRSMGNDDLTSLRHFSASFWCLPCRKMK